MSLTALKLVAQRTKDLVFGYCRQNEKKYKHGVYPNLVRWLCLIHTIAVKDEFQLLGDSALMEGIVEVRSDEIIGKGLRWVGGVSVVLGTNQAENGIHIWNIEINKKGSHNAIGVTSDVDDYSFNLGAGLFSGLENHMDVECNDGAKTQLTLNCNDWTLLMEMNDKKYDWKLRKGKYKLRIAIFNSIECNFKLLKYNHIV